MQKKAERDLHLNVMCQHEAEETPLSVKGMVNDFFQSNNANKSKCVIPSYS